MNKDNKHTYLPGQMSWALKIVLFIFIVFSVGLTSCSKMNDSYRGFWENGEKLYPGSADSIHVHSGKNRIELSWIIQGDPSVTRAKIYWNNKTDSLEVPIQRKDKSGVDTINVILKDMPEGAYSFDIYTYDDKGNHSVEANATGHSYGDSYSNSLLIRIINSAFFLNDSLTIVWGDLADQTSLGSEIAYTDTSGAMQHLHIEPNEDTTLLTDYDFTAAHSFEYRTLFLPDTTAIDTFYTDYETVRVLGPRADLPKDTWTVTASSYDNRSGRTDRTPEKAIDNDISTAWINLVGSTDYPHEITVDMQEAKTDIYGISFYFTSRAETPATLDIYISDDGTTWQLMGLFSIQNVKGWQYIDFPQPESFRYFKVKAETSYGSPNITIYEAGVFSR